MNRLTDELVYTRSDFDEISLGWTLRTPRNRQQRRRRLLLMTVYCVCFVLMIGSVVYLCAAVHAKWFLLGGIPAYLGTLIVRNLPQRSRSWSQRDWQACGISRNQASFWANDEGLEQRTTKMDVLYPYDKVWLAAESRDAFSLVSGIAVMVIPKRALTEAQKNTIRHLLQEKIPGFVVIPAGEVREFAPRQ